MAARRGRADLLDLFERRGIPLGLTGIDSLLAACARNESAPPQALDNAGKVLAEFAGNGNTAGVHRLPDLGVDVAARFHEGDIYWDIAKASTALHVAAWRAEHETVKLLIERGADVHARDGKGRTPLMLAVRACVESYWTRKRSPVSAEALLKAGASLAGVNLPSGYAELDDLLGRYAT